MARHGVAGIFGQHTVDVDVNTGALSWVVKATDGRVLLQVPWYWAYDQTALGKRVYSRNHFLTNDEYVAHASRWEAFEVCMCAYPLTSEHRQLLEEKYRGLTSRQQYVVLDPIWQPEVREPPRPAAPRNRTPRSVPPPETVVVTPQSTPQENTETAHEAGERKLLL